MLAPQIENKLMDAGRVKARGKSDVEDVVRMYHKLYQECQEFGWNKITKPIVVARMENTFLPDSDSESETESGSHSRSPSLNGVEDANGGHYDDGNDGHYDDGNGGHYDDGNGGHYDDGNGGHYDNGNYDVGAADDEMA